MTSTWLPKLRLTPLIAGLLAALVAFQPLKAAAVACQERLNPKDVEFQELHGTYIKVNGVAITGEFLYPLDFVLKNLDLTRDQVARLLRGKKVLSLAEGISGFIPFLLSQGIDATGVDLWYHSNHYPRNFSGYMMQDYVRQHGKHLLQGDARDIPVASNSIDMIFSHMLVNNLKDDLPEQVIKDTLRVLKPGGEARIYGFDDQASTTAMENYLRHNFADKVDFKFKMMSSVLDNGTEKETVESNLLIIRKKP